MGVLGRLDGSDIDDLCQWANSKITVCCDEEITIENLLEPIETKGSMTQSLQVDIHENLSKSSHDIHTHRHS